MNNEKIYLGVDWGSKWIGLAQAESETCIALHAKTIENTKIGKEDLKTLLKDEGITDVVIGVPRHTNDSRMEETIRSFGSELEETQNVSVHFANEMFSSKMAQENLRGALAGTAVDDHQEAARIILQDWIDTKEITA